MEPLNSVNPTTASNSNVIVPMQNNLAQEKDWCQPCNQPHNQGVCQNGGFVQTLVVQDEPTTFGQQYDPNQPSVGPQAHLQGDSIFVNWQEAEFCGLNQTNGESMLQYTRSKKRAMEVASPSTSAQAPTPNVAVHDTSQSTMQGNKRQEEAQVVQRAKADLVASKGPVKSVGVPFNIVDQMKKAKRNVTMWDALSIPSQRDLLKEELKDVNQSNDEIAVNGKAVSTSLVQPKEEEDSSSTLR